MSDRTVWKYPLEIKDRQTIEVPVLTRFLHVGLDPQGELCLWAEVNPLQKKLLSTLVYVVGTGGPVPENGRYFGSYTVRVFVWHVYLDRMQVSGLSDSDQHAIRQPMN